MLARPLPLGWTCCTPYLLLGRAFNKPGPSTEVRRASFHNQITEGKINFPHR